jgi:hypothetical protein
MNKTNVTAFFKSVQKVVVKHSPEILTGIGIAGLLTTTVLAVKATPKALKRIEEEKKRQNDILFEEAKAKGETNCAQITTLKPLDVVKVTWQYYIPAAVTGLGSVACIVGASSVNAKRNAALATAYALSETALKEYQDKVVETIGEKKEQVIREQIDKDHIDRNPVSKLDVIDTRKGNTLCYDYYSGRYFYSDIEEVKKAVNLVNSSLLRDDYVSLNELYDDLGLPRNGIGDSVGWNVIRLGRELVTARISSQVTDDGRPAIVVSCEPSPNHTYTNY